MKLSFSSNKLMVLILNIFIISGFVTIGYYVIYGLIIEPNLPLHWYGIGDFMELMYSCWLLLMVFLLYRVRRFYYTLDFFKSSLNFANWFGLKNFVIFRKVFKISSEKKFDPDFLSDKESRKVYLGSGICLGNVLRKSYFFACSFSPIDNMVTIYKVLFTGKVPEMIKILTIPINSQCEFQMEFKFRSIISWSVSTMGKGGYRIEYYEEMIVQKKVRSGIKFDGLNLMELITEG